MRALLLACLMMPAFLVQAQEPPAALPPAAERSDPPTPPAATDEPASPLFAPVDQGCDAASLPPASIRVDVEDTPDPPIDRSLNTVELTYSARQLRSEHVRGGKVLGLTKVRFSYRIGPLRFAGVMNGDALCVYPAEIEVQLQSRQEVLVVKTSPAGSCWDKAILEHEMQHVAFNNEAVHLAAEVLPARLASLVATAPGDGLHLVGRDLARTVGRVVAETLTEKVKDIQAKHQALDAPGAGERLRARCVR